MLDYFLICRFYYRPSINYSYLIKVYINKQVIEVSQSLIKYQNLGEWDIVLVQKMVYKF